MNMPLVLLNRRRRGGAAAFTPAGLFALAEPGVWYDPSDLTTLFQDTAGTTPVTTPGQTVALALDKSKGLALGSELVANGDFSSGTTSGFIQTSGNVGTSSVISGELNVVAGGSGSGGFYQDITVTQGATYLLTVKGRRIAGAGSVRFQAYDGAAFTTLIRQFFDITTTGAQTSYSAYVRTTSTTTIRVYLYADTSTTGGFDDVSLKLLPGFHATQATLASRPTYGIVPLGGRRNILLNTDTMATQSRTVTAVAHTLSFTGTGTVTLTGASIAGPLIGTGAGNRVSLTFTPTAGSLTMTVVGSVTLAQLELGSTVTNYQRVGTSAFDVTEAGVASLSYLSFDGVDDFLQTPTITPGIDRAQVFAGVRKLSDATRGIVAEMSAAASAGAWNLNAPNATTTANYAFRNVGSLSGGDAVTSSTFAAPTTNVLTAIGDIAADVSQLRVNGSVAATSAADLGTGNYAANILYIGRRAGTSLPFNGNIFSIIVRFGTNLDAGTITSTETWVGGKTGVTL